MRIHTAFKIEHINTRFALSCGVLSFAFAFAAFASCFCFFFCALATVSADGYQAAPPTSLPASLYTARSGG
jgi:hypothetical protein